MDICDVSCTMSSKSPVVPQAMEHYDYRVKLIIIGDANSGKSCLLEQFRAGRFYAGSTHTIGVEFASKVVTVGDRRVKLQIWDTYDFLFFYFRFNLFVIGPVRTDIEQ